MAVALRKDGTYLGAFWLYRQQVRPFSDKQIGLLQNFAAQAVIAMENARLLTETREALEQQTATADVLQVINASPDDLTPVFDAILEKTLALCTASFGDLSTYDGEQFDAVAARGFPPALIDFYRNPFTPGPKSYFGQLVNGKDVLHIADMAAEFSSAPASPLSGAGVERGRALVELGNARTGLFLALRKDGALLGAMRIFRQEVQPFTDKQIALVENFAAQAVIAMENARLITETREALEQQTATSEVLGVINTSPGDLAPVFDAMLEKATRLCEATCGQLATYDGEFFHFVAVHDSQEYADFLSKNPSIGPPGSDIGRLIAGEDVVHRTDFGPEALPPTAHAKAFAELAGAKTSLMVALRKDSLLLGAVTVYRREARPFTDKQIALLQNFAAQAVIAMENARLLTETREALEQQTATAEVLQVINSSPGDLMPVFDAILEKAHTLCGAELGTLFTYDGERFWPVARHGMSTQIADARSEGIDPDVAPSFGRIVRGEGLDHIHDMVKFAAQVSDDATRRRLSDLIETGGIRTQLVVALRKDDLLLGAITANRKVMRPFSDKQIALLQNFAAQAVIAMENARLINETREALEQQTATAEVLQVINSSPGDLAPVFDAMLEKAMRLCESAFGALRRFDGKMFWFLAVRDASGAKIAHEPWVPDPGSASERIAQGESAVHIPDLVDTEEYRSGVVSRVASVEKFGARSGLWVALRKDDLLVGDFVIYRKEVRPFSEKQIALVENFAAQAVIAMENARLLDELRQRTDEVAELNRGLEARVAEQVEELGRVGRLKRFLAPQLAELIVSQGDEKILESHRQEIVVVFCDLRGYTAFTETAEPEEVLAFLREYHGALGPLVAEFEGTLDQFSGDGIMVFFNDPVPCPDPAERAVKMAVAMREAAGELIASWRRRRGRVLGFGAGIAQGYATLGQIGFAERSGYTAIGTVCNLAARLCAEAKDGQILLAQPVAVAVEGTTTLEEIGELTLKGLTQPVSAFNVPLAATPPALRVIEGGPQSV